NGPGAAPNWRLDPGTSRPSPDRRVSGGRAYAGEIPGCPSGRVGSGLPPVTFLAYRLKRARRVLTHPHVIRLHPRAFRGPVRDVREETRDLLANRLVAGHLPLSWRLAAKAERVISGPGNVDQVFCHPNQALGLTRRRRFQAES